MKMVKKSELREWIDQQYVKDPDLRRRVEELVAQMEIEQGLIALREQRGVSQNALAKLIGVSQPAIAKLESGKAKNIELKTIARYVAALGGRLNIKILEDKPTSKVVSLPSIATSKSVIGSAFGYPIAKKKMARAARSTTLYARAKSKKR